MTQQVSPPIAPLRMPVAQLLFSLRGRIPRSTWWVTTAGNAIGCLLVLAVLSNAIDANPGARPMFGFMVMLVFAWAIWIGIAVSGKRWHDMDRSAWLILWMLVPYLGALTIIWYGFVRGTKGPNQYGPDPLASDPEVEAQPLLQADGPASGGPAA